MGRDGADGVDKLRRGLGEGLGEGLEAASAGLDFARHAGRRAWAPLVLATLGQAAVFAAGRADLTPAAAQALGWSGAALSLAAAGPKLGALHRAAGHAPAAPGAWAGLGWGTIEARLTATAVALAGLALVLVAGLGSVWVVLMTLLQPLGVVRLGVLGSWAAGFLLLIPLLIAGLAAVATGLGRMMLTLPAEAVEAQPRFARGWELTREHGGGAAGWVALLTCAGPIAALLAIQGGLDAVAGPGRWPLADVALAGGALAGLTQFVAAPVNAGALAHLYGRRLAKGAAGAGAGPAVAPPDAAGATPAAPEPTHA